MRVFIANPPHRKRNDNTSSIHYYLRLGNRLQPGRDISCQDVSIRGAKHGLIPSRCYAITISHSMTNGSGKMLEVIIATTCSVMVAFISLAIYMFLTNLLEIAEDAGIIGGMN